VRLERELAAFDRHRRGCRCLHAHDARRHGLRRRDIAVFDAEDRPARYPGGLGVEIALMKRRASSSNGLGSATVKVGPEMEFAPSFTT